MKTCDCCEKEFDPEKNEGLSQHDCGGTEHNICFVCFDKRFKYHNCPGCGAVLAHKGYCEACKA